MSKKEVKAEVKGTPAKDEKPTFDTIKWDSKDEMVSLFPTYIQEQLAMARQKTVSKTVDLFINLKKPLSNEYLLKDAQLLIEPNKRICLVGDPSCGKTTLFHALAHGEIKDFPKHLHVHHCEELGVTPEPVSILDAVVKAHEYRNCLLRCREELEKRINADEKPDDEVLEGLHANLDFVKFNLNKIRSDDAEERATKMLRVLGFDDMKKSTNALSGGLRMRVALCAAFFIEADLLLLDEPTNHLDFPSVLWLENRLRAYRSSFMLISHDRELLENVCTSLIRFDEKKLTYHNVGFAQFEKMKAAADKKKDAEIDKFMQANRNVDPSSQKAKEKADKAAWQAAYQNKLIQLAGKFTFPDSVPLKPQPDDPADPLDISLIKLTDVRFSYDPAKGLPFIFDKPISINITCRTRMGIMGPNGAGKSTLLKLLTKRLVPTEGKRTEHPTATVAYFAQHHAAELNMEMTAMEYMISQFPEVKNNGLLRKHLEKVGIAGPLADTRMKSITAGQRSCVIFAKITYICPHLLIMDEPTNFLDLESVDSLISATNKYKGALLLVSHNRGFLKKCATHYLSVVPGKFEIYDDMKTCERATYSFIAELEEEGGAGKIGASALQKLPKHGSAAAGEKKEDGAAGEEKKEGDGAKVFSFSGSGKPTKVVKKVVVVKKEGAKAEAGAAAPKAGAAAPKAGAAAPKAGAAAPKAAAPAAKAESAKAAAAPKGESAKRPESAKQGGGGRGGRGGGRGGKN